jgi:hypothetical protein
MVARLRLPRLSPRGRVFSKRRRFGCGSSSIAAGPRDRFPSKKVDLAKSRPGKKASWQEVVLVGGQIVSTGAATTDAPPTLRNIVECERASWPSGSCGFGGGSAACGGAG